MGSTAKKELWYQYKEDTTKEMIKRVFQLNINYKTSAKPTKTEKDLRR